MEELIQRCSWATTDLYKEYHDHEWRKPVHDENKLFEMLILEGMQAGLSWLTILNKREAFRIAFDNFDYKKIALYDDAKIEKLMQNSRIVRNRLKIKSAITNAQQFIKIQESYGSFDSFIWSYVDGKPILNQFQTETDIPARTALSDQISKDLKKLGFKFVGSTIPLGSDCWPQPADSRMIIHSHRHGMRQQICVYARQGFGASPKCASGRPDAMLAKHDAPQNGS